MEWNGIGMRMGEGARESGEGFGGRAHAQSLSRSLSLRIPLLTCGICQLPWLQSVRL